jgi:hypothetical protein
VVLCEKKDTNFISSKKLSEAEKLNLEENIAKSYPNIVKSMAKFN